ncbi:hypothetical protein [Seohaeicola zhoushanensis]|uniref:Lipoprotein n=1 Tax=Seohaeicola zhoushanensis TaxID=1569283 RepID=A0A8J3GUY6_9RHOB|nr:hypothetical protein [Seohaeicola zhoushanensis]GHF37692.1 lipoprotein [Seohaeicola zhoushanensis]
MLVRSLIAASMALAVAGCAAKAPFADDATVAKARYSDPAQPSITLYTMVNNRTGKGGHSALLINASESVIFDPAGSFYADIVPERNDVLFGISPAVEQAYRSAHARSTFHVVRQTLPVSAAQAETAYQLALANGAVPGAFCANATSTLLSRVPGFEGIKTTFYPTNLQSQVAELPGVRTDSYYEGDSADLKDGLERSNAALNE